MAGRRLVIRSRDVESYSPPRRGGAYSSRMLIDAESVGSRRLVVNEFTVKPGGGTSAGTHPCPYDEVYYGVKGSGWLILGVDPPVRHRIGKGVVAFIPCNTEHRLVNPGRGDLVLLTVMPPQPRPGVNPLYDARKKEWGTSFRLREGAKEMSGGPLPPSRPRRQ